MLKIGHAIVLIRTTSLPAYSWHTEVDVSEQCCWLGGQNRVDAEIKAWESVGNLEPLKKNGTIDEFAFAFHHKSVNPVHL